MVDLAFLLITFFIFTTHLSEPNVMKLAMPEDEGDPTPTRCSETITILPASVGHIGWYDCADGFTSDLKLTDLKKLRMLVQQKQDMLESSGHKRSDLVVIIKPFEQCDYHTLISVLDEMTINEVSRYAIVEPEKDDVKGAESGMFKPIARTE